MDQRQESAVRALLKYDVASSNIELVEYLVTELKLPVAQAWTAVRQRHAVTRRGSEPTLELARAS
jgi:hypothetical protein